MTTTTLSARSSLTSIVNALTRIARSYESAYDRETSWDGGEWSGPMIHAGYERAVRAELAQQGWTATALEEELTRRTTSRWTHFSGLLAGDFTASCDACGGITRDVVSSRTTTGHDPSTMLTLSCGHVTL